MVRLHPRHCTEQVTLQPYTAEATSFAGTWAPHSLAVMCQVEGRSELAITADGVRAHSVLTIRIPPTAVLDDQTAVEDLAHEGPSSARDLIEDVPVQSLVRYRGHQSYVLAVREVLQQGRLAYLEVTTGDRPPLFGGWLVIDAILERTAGRDRGGDPLPVTPEPIPVAVLVPDTSKDPGDEHQQPETTAHMILPPDSPAVPASTDRVRVPTGPMAGRYQVEGDPLPHATRTVVQLRRL